MRTNHRHPWIVALGLSVALLTGVASSARGEPAAHGHWLVQLASGVSSMQLGDVRSCYTDVLSSYRAAGIPLDPQREFPPNIVLGGDVLYEVRPAWYLGLGSRYTWTHGYALYGDPSGTLDVVTRMDLLSVTLVLQHSWQASPVWAPFVELRTGTGLVAIDHSEKLQLAGLVTGSTEQTLTGHGRAPAVEFHVGARRHLGHITLVGATGYRYSKVPGPPFDLDTSGFVLTLGMAFGSH